MPVEVSYPEDMCTALLCVFYFISVAMVEVHCCFSVLLLLPLL
jgi:hypothetical protein